MDALDAGQRWRRIPQADEREVLRIRDARERHATECRNRNGQGAFQEHLRNRGLRGGHGYRGARLQALRRGVCAAVRAGRAGGLGVDREIPRRAVQQSSRREHGRLWRPQLRRRDAVGVGGVMADDRRHGVRSVFPGTLGGDAAVAARSGSDVMGKRGANGLVGLCAGQGH